MSEWTNKWTCPGWMYVPRKPHPQGMEYHTICCCRSGVLYQIEIVEGKDPPRQMPRPEFSALGPTTGLLLRLTRTIWNTGKFVCMDSGFCVLEALLELRKRVYSLRLSLRGVVIGRSISTGKKLMSILQTSKLVNAMH